MNADKKLSGEFDRFFLSSLLETVSRLTSDSKTTVKESITGMIQAEDISTLNNFLAKRSNTLTYKAWEKLTPDYFGDLSHMSYKGKTEKDFLEMFNQASELRYWLLPFKIVINCEPDTPKIFGDIVKWSIETINMLWDGTGGAVDVGYWAKIIELFPYRLLTNINCFASLCYEKNVIQRMIEELNVRTTVIGNIPVETLREFLELESYIHKYSKKSPTQKVKSDVLIKEMKEQGTSVMRLRTFAECSALFRLYSIRTVDIRLYSAIFCLSKEEQVKAIDAIANVSTVCEQMETKPREPDMG